MNKRKGFFQFIFAYHIVLIIPMLILSINILRMIEKQQTQRVSEEVLVVMNRSKDIWNQQMSIVKSFCHKCKFDKKYHERYSHSSLTNIEIFDDIKAQENAALLLNNIYIYDLKSNDIYSSSGYIYQDFFFKKICPLSSDSIKFINEFLNNDEEKICIDKIVNVKNNKKELVIITGFKTWGLTDTGGKMIIYTISDKNLELMFGSNSEGITHALIYKDKLLYQYPQNSNEMSFYDISLNRLNTKNASIYKEVLDSNLMNIYIVSKKYAMKGMAIYLNFFFLWLFSSMVVGIVLAFYFSHKRFNMFQKLYLNNENLSSDHRKLKQKQCIYKLLTSDIEIGNALLEECLENNINISRKNKCFVICSENNKNLNISDMLSLDNNLNEIYAFTVINDKSVYLIMSDMKENRFKSELSKLIISKKALVIGDVFEDISKIRYFYNMVLKSFSSSNQGDIEYPEKLLISLREAVTDEDLMREYLVLEEIYQVLSIFNEKYFMILLWDIVRILNLDIEDFSTKVLKNEESPELLLKKCLEDELKKLSSKKQLNAEKREQYQKKDIVEITNYISKHVLDNNFSVKSMATEFDVSVSNLSHFFKKNTGVTISNYITSIKLERAKYILLNSDKTIEDIAKSLGYSNATVFIEMFKKNTGESPGNYRKTQIKS